MTGRRTARPGAALAPALFVAGLLAVIVISNLWVYRRISSALDEDLGRRLQTIAGILVQSNIVDGNILYSDDDRLDRDELSFIDPTLRLLQRRNELDAILLLDARDYIVRYSSNDELYEIEKAYPHLATHLEAILQAIEERGTTASRTIEVAGSGIFLKSGFAPVYNILDEPVALLVAEASPDFFEVLGLVRGAMFSGALIAALLLVVVLVAYLGLQRQIRHAQAALERENRLAALGRLASQVAHEIRNPVSIIKYSAERMGKWLKAQEGGRRELDPELSEMVSFVEEETGRLHALTERYLAYTRHGEIQLSEIAPEELVESAARALEQMGLPEGIEIEVDLGDDLPILEGDRDLLRQALLNLGTNAAEALGTEGHLILFARSQPGSRGREVVMLGVEDSGPGIPEKERRRVFEALYSTREDGTGLGLFLVDQIARAHEGRARVDAAPGGGAIVLLELPVKLTGETGKE